jgi:hypothetical protein
MQRTSCTRQEMWQIFMLRRDVEHSLKWHVHVHFLVLLIGSIFIAPLHAVNELPLELGMNEISRPNGVTSTKYQRNAPQAAFSGAILRAAHQRDCVCFVLAERASTYVRECEKRCSCSDIMLSWDLGTAGTIFFSGDAEQKTPTRFLNENAYFEC